MFSALQSVSGVPYGGLDHLNTEGRSAAAGLGVAPGSVAAVPMAGDRAPKSTAEGAGMTASRAGSPVFRLGHDAVERIFGNDSPVATLMRKHRAVSALIRASTIPSDKQSFRAEVRRYLEATYQNDASFRRALKEGTLVIHTTDEVPELNFQPLIEYIVHEGGEMRGHGLYATDGFNDDLYQELGRARQQARGNIGLRQFYAWWPA